MFKTTYPAKLVLQWNILRYLKTRLLKSYLNFSKTLSFFITIYVMELLQFLLPQKINGEPKKKGQSYNQNRKRWRKFWHILTIIFTRQLESVSIYFPYCCYEWTISAPSTNGSTYTLAGSIDSCSFKGTVSETLPHSHIPSTSHMLLDYSLLHTKRLLYFLSLKRKK